MTAAVALKGIHTGGAVQGQNAEDEKEDVFPAMPGQLEKETLEQSTMSRRDRKIYVQRYLTRPENTEYLCIFPYPMSQAFSCNLHRSRWIPNLTVILVQAIKLKHEFRPEVCSYMSSLLHSYYREQLSGDIMEGCA
jgi:hypothetical protein